MRQTDTISAGEIDRAAVGEAGIPLSLPMKYAKSAYDYESKPET